MRRSSMDQATPGRRGPASARAAVVVCLVLGLAPAAARARVGAAPQLSDAERADLTHVVRQMRDLTPFGLDLADDRSHRFFLKQLALGGQSAERSPQLYRTIETQRRNHQAGGFQQEVEVAAPEDGDDEGLTELSSLNYITSLGYDGSTTFSTSAVSSVEGGTISTTMTLALYDAATNQLIGNPVLGGGNDGAFIYDIGATGTIGATQATGAASATAATQIYSLYTYYWVDNGGALHGPYSMKLASSGQLPTMNNVAPTGPTPSLASPIILCINRTPSSANHCTYAACQSSGGTCVPVNEILFPVTGSVTYPNPIDFQNNAPVNPQVTMLVVNTTKGGGCRAWGPNTADFFAAPTTTFGNNNTVLNYNFPQADFGPPTTACITNGTLLNYTFVVQLQSQGMPVVASVTSTPPTTPGSNAVQIPQMQAVTGCLAAGTRIELADGTEKPIEQFTTEGETVRTGNSTILTVLGNTEGREPIPMVYLEDDREHTLLLTRDHTVVTVSQGVRLAHQLAAGDRVVTAAGHARLVKVEERRYDGTVHNLLLGVPGEHTTKDNTTMFANGFLVGDGTMQAVYGEEHSRHRESVLSRLPKEWHQDYLNSLAERRP